jgi:hypothetical protein
MKTTPVELNNDRERMIYALAYKNGVAAIDNILSFDNYNVTTRYQNYVEQVQKINGQWQDYATK